MLRKRKVLAGGAFNILHPGHAHFLQEARRLGGTLVVVVASDKTVKKTKKLLFPASYRAERISAFSFVDKVVIGDDEDMMKVVLEERPDVIALGYDQDEKGLKRMLDRSGIKCRIARIEKLKDYSTKKITEGRK
jgi:FAD synthetase